MAESTPEFKKILFQAQVDEAAKNRLASQPGGRVDADLALEKANWDAEFASRAAFEQAVISLLKDSVDRSKSRAELVEKAAASIAVIYGGILGVSFSVTEKPLPLRGLIPAFFLGLAIVLAMVYLAFLTKVRSDDTPPIEKKPIDRLGYISGLVDGVILTRVSFLRAAVVSLGIAVFFLPLPYIHLPGDHSADAVAAISWPTPPTDIANADLAKILYQAQVDEAKTLRARPTNSSPGGDNTVWVIALVGLLATFAIPFSVDRAQKAQTKTSAKA
jgi:hypothetical protein